MKYWEGGPLSRATHRQATLSANTGGYAMSDAQLEAIKANWSKVYEAVETRGRPGNPGPARRT